MCGGGGCRVLNWNRCFGGQVIKGLEQVLEMAERALEGKKDVKVLEDIYRCEGACRVGEWRGRHRQTRTSDHRVKQTARAKQKV